MQAEIEIRCSGCGRKLPNKVKVDTASMADEVQMWINTVILAHRPNCPAYGGGRSLVAESVLRGER